MVNDMAATVIVGFGVKYDVQHYSEFYGGVAIFN
jgi:hypothetical protein